MSNEKVTGSANSRQQALLRAVIVDTVKWLGLGAFGIWLMEFFLR